MKDNPPPPDFSVSQKIYRRLLLAYPRSHRAKYCAAMAQLFRDQCRDAWNESHSLGLLELWLRVLPDLAKTSFIERLAALNERKSMSDKITALIQPRTIFLKVFAAVFLITVLLSVVLTYILPETYASSAEIMLRNTNDEKSRTPDVSSEPNVIQAEMETVDSDPVLGAVIKKLALDQEWSKRYANGRLLGAVETMKLLRQRLIIRAIGKSPVLLIQVYDDKPEEARSITSAIIESYFSYRLEHHSSDQKKLIDIRVIQTPSPPYHARPNKPLNITLGALAGTFLASVVGGVAAFIALRFGKRNSKTVATV